MRAPSLTALVAAVLLAFASPAAAQSGGVFIDPGSPTAKEYGIPLETARRQANPGADPKAPIQQGEHASPLFGEGISTASGRGTKADGSSGSPSTNGSGSGAGMTPPQVLQAASNPGTPTGGASTPAVVDAVAFGVLVLGGGAGLLLRRRRD
jgi:hypothetical protein